MDMTRRNFLAGSTMGAAAALSGATGSAQPPASLRACIIGDSAQGQYGHSLHRVFELCPTVKVVGLADPVEAGRAKFGAEAKAQTLYADYREMLEKERPELVAIGPRWTSNHRAYLEACVAIGAHGIIEKPLAADLAEADAMVSAVESKNLKWGIGFNFRILPEVQLARKAIMEEGVIGEVLEIRGRGKEDHRAGGEDLIVLGTHIFDLMRFFLGDAQWVNSDVTVGGKPMVKEDRREATEPVGPIAGDRVHAMYGFANGVTGYFSSMKTADNIGAKWGIDIFGSKGMLSMRQNGGAHLFLMKSPTWTPSRVSSAWESLPGAAPTAYANPEAERYLPIINDVIAKMGQPGLPMASIQDGRASLEMIQGIYAAHLSGSRTKLPLQERTHPLA